MCEGSEKWVLYLATITNPPGGRSKQVMHERIFFWAAVQSRKIINLDERGRWQICMRAPIQESGLLAPQLAASPCSARGLRSCSNVGERGLEYVPYFIFAQSTLLRTRALPAMLFWTVSHWLEIFHKCNWKYLCFWNLKHCLDEGIQSPLWQIV